LCEPDQVWAGQVVMMPDLRPAHAAEKTLCVVRVDLARQAVGFLMVDPVQGVTGVKLVP